jgi:cobalt-zinc-cadmium efflux system outer membrane protein
MTMRTPHLSALLILAIPIGVTAQPNGPLTLERAVERFLQRNLAVEATRHRVDVARAEQLVARARPNPTVTLSAENIPYSGPTPASELYEIGTTYSHPIELGGKRDRRLDVAEATVAVAEAQLADTIQRRLLDLKRAFYEVVLARHAVEQATENRRALDALVTLNETRLRAGAIAEGEVIKARVERGKADTALAHTRLELQQTGIKLLDILGESDFATAGMVEGGLAPAPGGVPDLMALRATALQRRPAIVAAEQGSSLATRRVALEEARRTPDVSPFVGLRRVGENNTVLFGVSIPLPIIDRNEGSIARARAEARAAEADLALQRNRVLAEVEAAYRAWENARDRAAAFDQGLLRQADEAQSIARAAYQEGAIELLAYLEAQRTHAEIQHQYLRALFDAQVSVLQLEHAVGEELPR